MSRKTRKLIWSAPLVAVLAVAGALAIFVALSPGGALAHDADTATAPHLPPGPATGIDVDTPTVADGGRTSLVVSWNVPDQGPVTEYRLDMSTDALIWHNVVGGEEAGKVTLTESDAASNCTSSDADQRCFTVTKLESDTIYYFRVFASNHFGIGPISDDDTIGSGRTLRMDPPGRVLGLDATDYYDDKIVLTWGEQAETGGGDLEWYCVAAANYPSGPFPTAADIATTCGDATDATDIPEADADGEYTSPIVVSENGQLGDLADPDVTNIIVVEAPATTYEHLGLHEPSVVTLRYRLYAVTEDEHGNRRVSRAASETAIGKTTEPRGEPDEREATPGLVQHLRAVAFSTDAPSDADNDEDTPLTLPDPVTDNQGLYFYWTHPEGYRVPGATDDAAKDWYAEVQRRVTVEDDQDYPGWAAVTEISVVNGDDYANPQFAVSFADAADTGPRLWGATSTDPTYRVRLVNPAGTDADAEDDVRGGWVHITLPEKLDKDYYLNRGGIASYVGDAPHIHLADHPEG